MLSTRNAVPACRSLDCITLMARTVAELRELAPHARQYDPLDPMSRPWHSVRDGRGQGAFTFAVPRPEQLQFFGDSEAAGLYAAACDKLTSLGGTKIEIDYAPFAEAAALLYQGPWVAERYAAVGEWLEEHHAEADPTVSKIILGGRDLKASAVYHAAVRLAELRRISDEVFAKVDFLVVPTVPSVYTIAEVQANPVELNSRLGTYNNFVNLLDLAAVAVPAGRWSHGVGFGLNLVAPAFADDSSWTSRLVSWGNLCPSAWRHQKAPFHSRSSELICKGSLCTGNWSNWGPPCNSAPPRPPPTSSMPWQIPPHPSRGWNG